MLLFNENNHFIPFENKCSKKQNVKLRSTEIEAERCKRLYKVSHPSSLFIIFLDHYVAMESFEDSENLAVQKIWDPQNQKTCHEAFNSDST